MRGEPIELIIVTKPKRRVRLRATTLANEGMAYHAVRAEQEHNRVATARSNAVRALHQLLAYRYQAILDSGTLPEPRRGRSLPGLERHRDLMAGSALSHNFWS